MEAIKTATLLEYIQDNTVRLEFNKAAISDDLDVAALPDDTRVLELEKFRPLRSRFRGDFLTRRIDDFVSYTVGKADSGAECFVWPDDMTAKAVLNLGDLNEPGHADNTATIKLKTTAAFDAIKSMDGKTRTQQQLAEWLEDWRDNIRGLTIKANSSSDHTEGQLSSTRSAMEQVEASSNSEPLPSFILFSCEPYTGLTERTFILRLSLRFDEEKPLLALRIIRPEQHEEEMAEEFATLLQQQFGDQLPVTIGNFSA
ncbi:DUF2303 family protein [Alcanivorax sp. IL3]|uniref:DUF2303 family protein n=1 Tax=unclassified Alcanivorax TaxID=2638842 RepID=UPI0039C445A4